MTNIATRRAREQEFLHIVPFFSQPICNDKDLEIPCPIAVWKSTRNICEGGGNNTRCDDSGQLYYTHADDPVTYWCPRHWYDLHFGSEPLYRLLDMTDDEFCKACDEHKQRLLKDWQVASERIQSAARILADDGFQEEAGRLWQAHGYIDSRVRHL